MTALLIPNSCDDVASIIASQVMTINNAIARDTDKLLFIDICILESIGLSIRHRQIMSFSSDKNDANRWNVTTKSEKNSPSVLEYVENLADKNEYIITLRIEDKCVIYKFNAKDSKLSFIGSNAVFDYDDEYQTVNFRNHADFPSIPMTTDGHPIIDITTKIFVNENTD